MNRQYTSFISRLQKPFDAFTVTSPPKVPNIAAQDKSLQIHRTKAKT